MHNYIIATHELVYGAPQALREYLLEQGTPVLFIGHPLIDNDSASSAIEFGAAGCTKVLGSARQPGNLLSAYSIQFFRNIHWVVKAKKKNIIYIGVNPINSLAGGLLRILRLIDFNIYYTIDFTPARFQGKTMNYIYHLLDVLCVWLSDETWNVSPKIAQGRSAQHYLLPIPKKKQFVVPIGVWLKRIKRASIDDIKLQKVIFIGHLLEKQGVHLVVEAIHRLRDKVPALSLTIVGGGPFEINLRALVKERKLDGRVQFLGWIKDRRELDKVMSDSAFAVAPYLFQPESFSQYADSTKLKDYLSAGLPVIVTRVPHNAQELADAGCALIVEPSPVDIAEQMMVLLTDGPKLLHMQAAAIDYISDYDWSNIFVKNLARVTNQKNGVL